MKVRDALGRSGNSGEEKDKFPWFDVLDQILGTKPIVDHMDIVESYDASSGASPANTTTSSYSVDSDGNGGNANKTADTETSGPTDDTLNTSTDIEACDAAHSKGSRSQEGQGGRSRLAIPGAQSRKRKARSSLFDELQVYQAEQMRQLE
ncbi:hypothetical protein N1851_033904 [Merluccius polli]|uniref:Uncharacterized protein n=1 Tax=Merluccius polli TaxID=89951 RepID=A0AA47M0L6_MERPO|nr:hypothetical protein N1851_033904 [Merluccius polli]